MIRVNKLFRYLSIRKKLIIAFTLLSIIPLLVVGILGIAHNISTMRHIAFENLKYDHGIRLERAESFFKLIGDDIHFIAHAPSFRDMIHSFDQASLQNKTACVNAGALIAAFCTTKKKYFRFYFIDRHHRQIFKVEHSPSGKYEVTPPERLEKGHFPFYFHLIENLKKDDLAFVPVELNTGPETQISAISFAMPIYQNGKFAGILVADVHGKYLFDIMESRSILNFRHRVSIISSEGLYVYDSQKKKDWNRLLALRNSINFFNEYKRPVTDAILSGKTGILTGINDEILTYSPLINSHFSGKNTYILMNRISEKYITSTMYHFAELFIPVILLFLLLAIYFAILATRQLIRPIRQLQEEVRFIARGNYTHSFAIDTNDEIEDLAIQFNIMAEAVRDREKRLSEQQENLENMVQQRTLQLKDERNKIRAILNNVPSAFILYSAKGNILLASDAIASFLEHSPAYLTGKKYNDLFWPGSKTPLFPQNYRFNSPKPVMEIQDISGIDGARIIEHMLMPVQITDKEKATLHIITDITDKRRMENHLIKIEKLVATGEMSAILAHELRNSVTSVKMILQLQLEANTDPRDRDSLRVAIDSILNMETILNNLLKFARPTPLQLVDARINDIIEDALIFLEPRIRKKQIIIEKQMDVHLPLLRLDAVHLKEAFINIILNAIQALNTGKRICLKVQKQVLPKRIEDFGYDEQKHNRPDPELYRIVLEAGENVVFIEICDNGPGIPAGNLEKIFDPFFTTKLDGTGLGLAMTKRVINQHNGIIKVSSIPGEGTTFFIYLPMEQQ